jgi:hypothetical protein
VRKKHLAGLMAAAALLALAGWLPAAAQITTGSISGKVVDEKGDPLPGALITARNRDTGLERAVPTDSRGEYRLLGLPPAIYVVQATLTGFGAPLKTIVVNLGQNVPLNFEMKPGGGLKEELEVTAEPPLVNTTKAEVSTVVTETQVRSFPLLQRDYNDLAQLSPGVKPAPSGQFDPTKKQEIYSPFTTGGSSGRNVNISIDGADNNDSVVGFFVQGFTTEGIQEFEVVQDQYKAEYGRSLGGVVNVITKSGTNDFGGSVFGYFFNESLRAKNYGERRSGLDPSETEREFFGFSVGGPIIEDKLFYFAALERRNDREPFALSSILTSFAGATAPNFPFTIPSPGTTLGADFERDLWTVRFDYNLSKSHLLWVRWSRDNADALNDQGGALSGPENQGNSTNDVWSAVLNWQWNIRGNMINELKIHRNDFENRVVSLSPDPILTLSFENFDIGRNINTPQATFQNKFQVRDDFSFIAGRHSFKAGIEAIRIDLDDSFLGPPATPALQFLFNPGVDPNDAMLSGDNPTHPVPNVDPTNGVDDGLEMLDEIAPINPGFIPGTRYYQYGAYFQDDWEVSDRWRLNLGIRVDHDQDLFKDAEEGINKAFYECFANPRSNAACGRDPNDVTRPPRFEGFDNTFPEDQTNVSPRIGFVYRVGGEDKDVLRGSWGLFYDKLVDNLVIFMRQNLSPFFSPSLPVMDCWDITDPNFSVANSGCAAGAMPHPNLPPLPVDFTLSNWVTNATDPNGVGLRDWFGTLTSILGQATFDDATFMPSPDWKTPYTSAVSVGWGHTFSTRLALDTNLIYRRGFHQLFRQSIRGRNSGNEAPFPVVLDPNLGSIYPGQTEFFTTDGKSQYVSLQMGLKGRWPNFDFGVNLNLSQALGTQDNAGTAPTDGGPIDIFEGGNIRFTGGDVDGEWGRISGDQTLYTFLYGIYRLPLDFQTAAQITYGTKTAFHGFAGVDLNGDGFVSANEYAGTRGSGQGDDYFNINWRGSKFFNTGKGTKVELYADVFNVLNRVNHGLFVIHQQLTVDANGNTIRNPQYGKPTTDTLSPFSRRLQWGLRFTF